jgi:hypothetical protein
MSFIRFLQHNCIIFSLLVFILGLTLLLKKKQISKLDAIIVYCFSLDSFFNIFNRLIDIIKENKKIVAFSYDLLFPLFIVSIVVNPKKKNLSALLAIGLTIAFQLFERSSKLLPALEGLKIGLSFIACLALLYVVFKTFKEHVFKYSCCYF